MRRFLLFLSFLFLLSAASSGQVFFTMTNLGNGRYEVYATLTQEFPATEKGILGNVGLVFGTMNSPETVAPTYSFTINPTFNTYYGGAYTQVQTDAAMYGGYTYQSFNLLSSPVGTAPRAYPAGSVIDLGTLAATGGVPASVVDTGVSMMDFSSGGADGNGNTYVQDGSGTYYTPSYGNAGFKTTTGPTGTTAGGTGDPIYLKPNKTILPVRFASIGGTASGCMANLVWKTGSESNSAYYDVEASLDGKVFAKVAQVPSKNRPMGADYSFAYALNSGTNFYRLKAVDFDGHFAYSGVVMVNGTGACGNSIQLSVLPNPTSSTVNVSGIATGSTLSLFSMGGQKLWQSVGTSTNQVINIGTYASGVYMLRVIGANGAEKTVKVIKQ